MKNNISNKNIILSVAERIVKFYCGIFSHSLSALKFQSNIPLSKKEREDMERSGADTSKVNS